MRKGRKMLKLNLQVSCDFRFEPIITLNNKLYAVELLTRFEGGCFGRDIEPQSFINSLNEKSVLSLLLGQLTEIDKKSSFFVRNNLLCSVNIDSKMAEVILKSNNIRDLLEKNKFIRLEISENFSFHNKFIGHSVLQELSAVYPLWLDDYGKDFNDINKIKKTRYELVKIDKNFFWENRLSVMWTTLISQVSAYCDYIIVEGVESENQFKELMNSGVLGVQGFLFPSVPLSEVESLMPKK